LAQEWNENHIKYRASSK